MFIKKNKIQGLVNVSQNIVSVFTDTIDKLTTVNGVISTEIETKEEAIEELQKDVVTLDQLRESNDKIISKVKQILE